MACVGWKKLASFIQNTKSISVPFGFLLVLSLQLSVTPECMANQDMYRLYDDLFTNYNKHVRPVFNRSSVIEVGMEVFINLVLDMEEKKQTFITNAWVTLEWVDEYLRWNLSEYGNVSNFKIQSSKIWTPDIFFYQNAAGRYESLFDEKLAVISNNGHVHWAAPTIFTGHCKIDPRFFPFDGQECVMKFGTWQYDGTEVSLSGKQKNGSEESTFLSDGEWDLDNFTLQSNVEFYPDTPGIPYTDVTYYIHLRRRPLFYIFYLLIPCVIISSTIVLSFFLPPENPGKISLGITVLLSLTMFLLLVADFLPPADTVPILGHYYAAVMILVSTSLAMNVWVTNLYYRGPDRDSPFVPYILQRLLRSRIPYYFNIHIEKDALLIAEEESLLGGVEKLTVPDSPIAAIRYRSTDLTFVNGHVAAPPGFSKTHCKQNERKRNGRKPINKKIDEEDSEDVCLLKGVLCQLQGINDHNFRQDKKSRQQREWRRVAKLVDRICMLLYLIGTASTLMVIFCQVPTNSLKL